MENDKNYDANVKVDVHSVSGSQVGHKKAIEKVEHNI